MKNLIFIFVGLILSFNAESKNLITNVSNEVYCFISNDGKEPIKMELMTYIDRDTEWYGGYIQYFGSKNKINIFLKNKLEEILDKNGPYQVTRTLQAIYENKVIGEFEMMNQGAMVYSMIYTDSISHKKTYFDFETNIPFSPEKGCEWDKDK